MTKIRKSSYTPWRKFDSWLFTHPHDNAWTTFAFDRKSFRQKTPCSTDPIPSSKIWQPFSVKAALEDSPTHSEAVILHYFHQFTASEIAQNDEHTAADGQITASCRQKYTLR